jgi:PAS domain S-box-containing protein
MELAQEVLAGRVLVVDDSGKVIHAGCEAAACSLLAIGKSVPETYPDAWPMLEEAIQTGGARLGIRLDAQDGGCLLDVYPTSALDAGERKLLGWVRQDRDRDTLDSSRHLGGYLRRVFDSLKDGLWICDNQANVIYINQAYERKARVKAEEIVGRNMRDLVAEGFVDVSVTLEVLAKRQTVTLMQRTHDGRRVLSTGNPVFDQNGEIVLVVTCDRNLSEIERLRDEILSKTAISERYLEELIGRQVEQLVRSDIIFRSPAMESLVGAALRIAGVGSTVLLTGASGSGKGKLAELVHKRSPRAEEPFIRVNCGAVPESLFESELFGYEPGSFTGARKEGKPGLVELADRGTLFLDEVAEIPLTSQPKLLQFLDDGVVHRVGATRGRAVDVRVIAATNQDLEDLVKRRLFREDLYYRLRVIPLRIPPLRERPEDIPALAEFFVSKFSQATGRHRRLSIQTIDVLTAYGFPGNVRELVNMCEWAVVMSPGEVIRPEDLPQAVKASAVRAAGEPTAPAVEANSTGAPLKERLRVYERAVLCTAMTQHRNQKEMARALGVDESTITRKLRKHNLRFTSPQAASPS